MKQIYALAVAACLCILVITLPAQTGNVGIGTISPNNKLQVGGIHYLKGYQFAIGSSDSSNDMALGQSNTSSAWYSSTNFSLVSPIAGKGKVGIGTLTPSFPLTLQTGKAAGNWGLVHTDSIVQFGDYISSQGIAEIGTRTNHPLYIFTNNFDAPPAIAIAAAHNFVGFNTTTPQTFLDVHGIDARIQLVENTYNHNATFSRYTNRLEIGVPDAFQVAIGAVAAPNLYLSVKGLGLNFNAPVNKLQIGNSLGYSGNDIAFGNSGQASALAQTGSISQWYATTSIGFMPSSGNKGNVGINTLSPVNHLQVGSTPGYSGNDIAYGNGAQSSAFAQTTNYSIWNATTNIAIMPQGNGHGRVGINTTTPIAPLEVDDYVQLGDAEIGRVEYGNGYALLHPDNNTGTVGFGAYTDFCQDCTANVSIYAAGNIMGLELDAISDARVKEIKNISDPGDDLQTLNKLHITNYTMKDKIRFGNKPYKKVIAQQVETVYPQVISKHRDFIPNVYQMSEAIKKTDGGYLITFHSAHHIGEHAGRLKIQVAGENTMNKYQIRSVPSENSVEIRADKLNGDRVFVYGEEVDDFRTVDYDGLATLNISATQQLSKQVTEQGKAIQQLTDELTDLKAELNALKNKK